MPCLPDAMPSGVRGGNRLRKKIRSITSLVIPMLAGAAFVFGAVRYWDIDSDRVVEMIQAAVILVIAMAVLALIAVALIKGFQAFARRRGQKR